MHVKSEPWRLMTLVEEAQRGCIAAGHSIPPWGAAQIEALWDNIFNEWPVGPFVLLDVATNTTRPWRGRIGPHYVRSTAPHRLLVEEGAGKLAALAWSLREPAPVPPNQFCSEEVALWNTQMLVLDVKLRRARFVGHDFAPNLHLPVHLLPKSTPCLNTMNAMELRPIDREWINQSARRLLDARCPIYIFPDSSTKLAERMLTNIRQIGGLDSYASL